MVRALNSNVRLCVCLLWITYLLAAIASCERTEPYVPIGRELCRHGDDEADLISFHVRLEPGGAISGEGEIRGADHSVRFTGGKWKQEGPDLNILLNFKSMMEQKNIPATINSDTEPSESTGPMDGTATDGLRFRISIADLRNDTSDCYPVPRSF